MNNIEEKILYFEELEESKTKIVTIDKEDIVNEKILKVVNDICSCNGSSYLGRLSGTKKILGVNYKAPIILEESNEIILFPTSSPRKEFCNWIALKNIKNYEKIGKQTKVTFVNDKNIYLNISYKSFDNQILRSARLQMLFKNRKSNLNGHKTLYL